jgi:hypothetical protein
MEYYKTGGAKRIKFSEKKKDGGEDDEGDYEKWRQERSDEENKLQKKALETVACPKCGEKNIIDDLNEEPDKINPAIEHVMSQNIVLIESQLEYLGFSSDIKKAKENNLIFAPHGICVGECASHSQVPKVKGDERLIWGTPLKLKTEIKEAKLFKKEFEEREEGESSPILFEEESTRGGLSDYQVFNIKNLYYNCIKLEDKIPLYPPYFVGEKTVGGDGGPQEDASGSHLGAQDVVGSGRTDEWWLQLEYLIRESERANKNKKPQPTRRFRLLLSAYFDKTSRLNNVESPWSFMSRLRMNGSDMKLALKHWPEHTPLFEGTVAKSNIEPADHRIDGLLRVINNSSDAVFLSHEEITEITTKAKDLLEKLSSTLMPDEKSTVAMHFHQNAWFSDNISFNGTIVPATAFLESLCVREASKSILDSSDFNSLSKYYLFPDSGVKKPWWESNLSEGCTVNYEGWNLLMQWLDTNQ